MMRTGGCKSGDRGCRSVGLCKVNEGRARKREGDDEESGCRRSSWRALFLDVLRFSLASVRNIEGEVGTQAVILVVQMLKFWSR